MWLNSIWTIFSAGVVGAYHIRTSSDSNWVRTKPVSLTKLIQGSPYYTLETSSCTDLGIDVTTIDTVCTSYSSNGDLNNANIQTITTLTCNSTVTTSGILTVIKPGDYHVNTTTLHFEDFVVDEPCQGTYVLYRCTRAGSWSDVDAVLIISNNRSMDDKCLPRAETLALNSFQNLVFRKLPNTVTNPCDC